MKRRQFIQLGTGLALGVLAGQRTSARAKDRIIIVGGGILGASMAYHLSRRGAHVTLLERTAPAAGATGKSFAWINANFSKQPRRYHLFSRLGVQAFRTLQQEVAVDLGARWTGTVEWYTNPERAEELRRMVRQQREWGYPIRVIGIEEFARLEPRIKPVTVLLIYSAVLVLKLSASVKRMPRFIEVLGLSISNSIPERIYIQGGGDCLP